MVIFSHPNCSISGIPNSAGSSPCTTKNLHLKTLSLYLNQTEKMYNSSMFELLYVFRMTELFFACNDSMVDSGNQHLNILNGIKLPSTSESILNVTSVHLWLELDSNLVNIKDFTLTILRYFTLTTSKLQSYSSRFAELISPLWCTSSTISWPTSSPVVSVRICRSPWNGYLFYILCISSHMQSTAWVHVLSHNIGTCNCARSHMYAFGCFVRWHQISQLP